MHRAAIWILLLVVTAAAARALAQTVPDCRSSRQHRELDFWIGEWDVYSGDRLVGHSLIESVEGGCGIAEHYTQPDGFSGRSLNFHDPVLGKWRQTWVDNLGNVSEFSGRLIDGAMQLEGASHRGNGATVLRRMVLRRLDEQRLSQYSERSTDGGTTWTVAYDFTYVRSGPATAD